MADSPNTLLLSDGVFDLVEQQIYGYQPNMGGPNGLTTNGLLAEKLLTDMLTLGFSRN